MMSITTICILFNLEFLTVSGEGSKRQCHSLKLKNLNEMKNPMKQVTIKGHTYDDICIIDGAIVCQSVNKDLIFEDGYTEVCNQLKDEWWDHGGYGNQRDYVLEYETEAILNFVQYHEGIEAVNNVN